MNVSVITAAVPSRADLLQRCVESVARQTHPPIEHLISVDVDRVGTSRNLNRLATAARGEWLAILCDDDTMYPNHLLELVKGAYESKADIIYPSHDFGGHYGELPIPLARPWDPKRMEEGNIVPATVLLRKKVWEDLKGWSPFVAGQEDYEFFKRAMKQGYKFHYVDKVTWTYYFHDGSRHKNSAGNWRKSR